MVPETQLELQRADWADAAAWFRGIRDDNWRGLADPVRQGQVGLFSILEDGAEIGALALGVNDDRTGLIVHALAAEGDVISWLVSALKATAAEAGLPVILCRTRRRGLVRRLEREGATARGIPGQPGRWNVSLRAGHHVVI